VPEKAQELVVTNTGQPIVVTITPALELAIAQGVRPVLPAGDVTVELTPAVG